MITIFNRKELLTTFDISVQAQVTDTLCVNNIDYNTKVFNMQSGGSMRNRTGGRATGTFGINHDYSYQYTVYVKKCDYEKACYVISNLKR